MEKKWSSIQPPPHPIPQQQHQHPYHHTPTSSSSSSSSYSHYLNGLTNPVGIQIPKYKQRQQQQRQQQQQRRKQQLRLKCIVLGAAGAGKTSILRRLVHNTFDLHRDSTLGADFYTHRIKNPLFLPEEEEEEDDALPSPCNHNTRQPPPPPQEEEEKERVPEYVSLQLWDTAGKERDFKNNKSAKKNKNRGRVPSLGDAFFRNADVAMLVYDATSSVSFMQLIRWYSELITRLSECSSRTTESGGDNDNNNHLDDKMMIPVLVVANKLDCVRMERSKPIRKKIVPQRDVMGLRHTFKGKDRMYEYSVTTLPQQQKQQQLCRTGSNCDLNLNHHPSNASSSDGRRHSAGALTYNMTDSEWSTDYSYLNSVMTAEDGSFPDEEMVLLWCRRNGLKHVEVSALDGTGLKQAIDLLVTQTIESIKSQKQQKQQQQQQRIQQQQQQYSNDKYKIHNGHSHHQQQQNWKNEHNLSSYPQRKKGEPLDFHKRYATKDDGSTCCWPFC